LTSIRRVEYTKSMTTTENAKCHFCQAAATALKTEAERDYDVDGDEAEKVTAVDLPICGTCAEEYYDGTEEYPGVRPLG